MKGKFGSAILVALAAAFGLTCSAEAAVKPFAYWYGGFSRTFDGVTLNLNGNDNSTDPSVIEITRTTGVTLDFTTTEGVTVLVAYSDLSAGPTAKTLATTYASSVENRTGVYLTAAGKYHAIWGGADYGADGVLMPLGGDSEVRYFALTYKSGVGTYFWTSPDGEAFTRDFGYSALHSSSDTTIGGCAIGGLRGASTAFSSASGMKIHGIALCRSSFDQPVDFTSAVEYWKAATKNAETISINFQGDAMTGDGLDGALAPNVLASSWIATSGASGTKTGLVSCVFDQANTSFSSATYADATVTWAASTTWNTSGSPAFMRKYLDDGSHNGINGVTISANNIPFGVYDVIIYTTTDTDGRCQPYTVNGVVYPSEAAWGTGAVNATPELGVNALRINNLTGPLNIQGRKRNGTDRGSVAAIQIVNAFKSISNIETASDIRTSEINAQSAGSTGYVFLEIAADRAIVFDADLACESLVVTCNGALSLSKEGDYAVTADQVAKLALAGVAGAQTWNIPAPSIEVGNVYTAGTCVHATIPLTGEEVSLSGGTYLLAELANGTSTTVNFADVTAVYSNALGIGSATYNLSGNTVVTTPKVILSQGAAGRTSVLNLSDSSRIVVTGSSNPDSNQASVMFGHWNGPSTVNINDEACFVATGADVLMGRTGNTQTINLNGGIFDVKGIKPSSIAGTSVVNFNGGVLRLGETGLAKLGGKVLTLGFPGGTAQGEIQFSTANSQIQQDLSIPAGVDLHLVGNAETKTVVALTGTISGEGRLVVDENVILDLGTDRGSRVSGVAVVFEGEHPEVRLLENISEDGVLAEISMYIPGQKPAYVLIGGDGSVKPVVDGRYEPSVSGLAAWYDFPFENSLASVGSAGGSLSRDAGGMGGDLVNDFKDGTALYTASHPYLDVTFPAEFTAAIYAILPKHAYATLMAFGSTSTGETKGTICLTSGATDDEVLLVRTGGLYADTYDVLATMAVPNATTTPHLYAFSKKMDAQGNTQVTVYLDGKLWSSYTASGAMAIGNGFQVGSLHGGIPDALATRIVRFERSLVNSGKITEDVLTQTTIAALRIYDGVLGPNAMRALEEEFPYTSPNGRYVRTLVGNDETWNQPGAWTKIEPDGTTSAVDMPAAGAQIELETTEGVVTTLAVNLAESMTTESLAVTGAGEVRLVRATGFSGAVVNSGATSIGCPVTLAYGAATVSGGPTTLGAAGALTFDLTEDAMTPYVTTKVFMTGLAESTESIMAATPVEARGWRYEFAYDMAAKQYYVQAMPPHEEGAEFDWVSGEYPAAAVFSRAGETHGIGDIFPGDTIRLVGSTAYTTSTSFVQNVVYADDFTGSLTKVGGSSATFTLGATFSNEFAVVGGTAKVGNAHGLGLAYSGATASVGTVRRIAVGEGAAVDVNGFPVVYGYTLNGGTLANTGAAIEADHQHRQTTVLDVTADSVVDATSSFGVIASQFGATRVDIPAGVTLTKVGAGDFYFANATVVGPGRLLVSAGSFTTYMTASAGDDWSLEMAPGTKLRTLTDLTVGALSVGTDVVVEGEGRLTVKKALAVPAKGYQLGATWTFESGATLDIASPGVLAAGDVLVRGTDAQLAGVALSDGLKAAVQRAGLTAKVVGGTLVLAKHGGFRVLIR